MLIKLTEDSSEGSFKWGPGQLIEVLRESDVLQVTAVNLRGLEVNLLVEVNFWITKIDQYTDDKGLERRRGGRGEEEGRREGQREREKERNSKWEIIPEF